MERREQQRKPHRDKSLGLNICLDIQNKFNYIFILKRILLSIINILKTLTFFY